MDGISTATPQNIGVRPHEQQLKEGMNVEGESKEIQEEVKHDGMDMDEEMMMAGLSMFENDF